MGRMRSGKDLSYGSISNQPGARQGDGGGPSDFQERPMIYSIELARIATALFGSEWGGPLARLTRTNERTAQRVRTAAAQGREYPAARGLLAALGEALVPILTDLEPHKRP